MVLDFPTFFRNFLDEHEMFNNLLNIIIVSYSSDLWNIFENLFQINISNSTRDGKKFGQFIISLWSCSSNFLRTFSRWTSPIKP